MTISNSWIETSQCEAELSAEIAKIVTSQTNKPLELCKFLKGLSAQLITNQKYSSGEINTLVRSIITNFPELKRINSYQTFPQTNQDLTTNFFARLANDVSSLIGISNNDGAVPTPAVIALDMTALSLAIFLSLKTNTQVNKIFGAIKKIDNLQPTELSELVKLSSKIIWYDPCVGGGVFPLAILTVLNDFGVELTEELLKNIEVVDKNPIVVEAAKIRVAMFLMANAGFDFTKTIDSLESFTVGNSLQNFTTAQNLFSEPNILNKRNKDIVIGNPPYVRADSLEPGFRQSIKSLYPEVSGGKVDLYNYFIAHGVQSLNLYGVLTFISPASFQKSNYGKKTRSFLQNKGRVWGVFDFDELPIFQSVSVHSSIYSFIKGPKQEDIVTHSFKTLPF